jgi:hypothetical protein
VKTPPGRDQLRLTKSAKRVRPQRLTKRQREVVDFIRWEGQITTREAGWRFGYRHPSAALAKLVDRGLLVHASRGVWKPARHRERLLPPAS